MAVRITKTQSHGVIRCKETESASLRKALTDAGLQCGADRSIGGDHVEINFKPESGWQVKDVDEIKAIVENAGLAWHEPDELAE